MTRLKSIPALVPLLILVFATFIGILIYTWVESDKANPQMLDEKGRVKVGQVGNPRPVGNRPLRLSSRASTARS